VKAKSAKAKGTRLEAQVVKDLLAAGLAAHRQPGSGIYSGFPHDVQLELGGKRYICECKARKDSFRTLDGWLGAADLLVVRNDRSDPRVYMTWGTFLELAQAIVDLEPVDKS
jgi:hypothetical protein